MPGIFDTSRPWADFMSPFRLYRTVAASDVDITFEETIDFQHSVSASRNAVQVLLKQTQGAAARLKLEFFVLLPQNGLPVGLQDTWILADKSTFLAPLELNRYENLPAGTYKLKAVLESTGTFEIYVSTSHNPKNV